MTTSPLSHRTILSAPGSFKPGANGKVTRVVMHRMEAPMRAGTAAAVANYFAGGAGGRGVSCHYCVDPSEVVACVQEEDRAFHAPPNAGSIGVEQSGYSSQDDWNTPAGQAQLDLSARLVADICQRHGLPARWLSPADLKAGAEGITSHHNVSIAWGQSTHTDPDPTFPTGAFMAKVAGYLGAPPPVVEPPQPPPPPQPQRPANPPIPQGQSSSAPPFPLPQGWYFGPRSGPKESVSGFYSHEDDLKTWQRQMAARGWRIDVDGHYGPQTEDVATKFQQEKGLHVDGKIGPETWAAAWTAPVT